MNQDKLIEVSDTELKIGFRKMKKALDEKNEDYKVLIFELEIVSEQEEQKA